MCAEQLITRRDRNGFPVREWQKMRERNEALDCYVYARAAASAAGLDRFEDRHWSELERQLGVATATDTAMSQGAADGSDQRRNTPAQGVQSRTTARRVVRSRWMN